MEAVFIKRKSVMTVLLLFGLALSLSMSTAFATDNTTKTTKTTKNLAAGSPAATSFTSSQINTAAGKVKTYVEKNKRLPTYVTINNQQVTMPQFLKLMTTNTVNLNSKKTKSVTLSTVKSPTTTVTENVKSGNLGKSEYVTLASKIEQNIIKYGKVPSSVTSSRGKINFQTMVYTYSKILNFIVANKRLPNTVSVKPWNVVSSKITSEGTGTGGIRPVYIISDNINNKSVDNNRINIIVSALKKLGLEAYNMGAGTNNIGILQNPKVPSNALIVQIMGGACAATIKETGTAWYKNLVGSKKVFYVWTQGAKKITGLNWLERAHDDNFSPYSFKGLANPDEYLLKNGYQYYEGYTNSKVNVLAKLIYSQATS